MILSLGLAFNRGYVRLDFSTLYLTFTLFWYLLTGESLVGLAADCKDRQFYYSDISSGTISRASLDNTSDSHVIIDGMFSIVTRNKPITQLFHYR